MLGVAPDDSLKELKSLYADHPYGEYLDAYSWDNKVKQKAAEKVQSFETDGLYCRPCRCSSSSSVGAWICATSGTCRFYSYGFHK